MMLRIRVRFGLRGLKALLSPFPNFPTDFSLPSLSLSLRPPCLFLLLFSPILLDLKPGDLKRGGHVCKSLHDPLPPWAILRRNWEIEEDYNK
eukprot:590862-Amorphochlora_amoeboformis.AAC.1